jgi:hypothetical protein
MRTKIRGELRAGTRLKTSKLLDVFLLGIVFTITIEHELHFSKVA